MYKNRSNPHVVERMIKNGTQKYNEHQKDIYLAHKKSLCDLKDVIVPDNSFQYVETIKKEEKIRELEEFVNRYESDQYQTYWDNRVSMLSNNRESHVAKLVFINNLLDRPTEIFYTNPDRCPQCDQVFVFNSTIQYNICIRCGLSVYILFTVDDYNQDLIVNRDPVVDQTVKGNKGTNEYQYMRGPLYLRYLQQFDQTIKIPSDVMKVLYQYLSNIHLQNSIRCRPTPVAAILRMNGMSKWAGFAVRISKEFNGDIIPFMSTGLIDRLVKRFNAIFAVSINDKLRLPSFEFLTHIFLRIEKEPELAESFLLHKSHKTVVKTMNVIYRLVDKLQPDPNVSWDNVPTF